MLEDLEKDQEYKAPEGGKRNCADGEASGSRQTMNIELKKLGVDLSSPIAELAIETKEVELYSWCLGKMIPIGKNMEPNLKKKVIAVV